MKFFFIIQGIEEHSINQSIMQNITRMIEQIKVEHESLRQPTTTHPSITRYYEILNNEETSKLDGSNSNNGINNGINKTIEDKSLLFSVSEGGKLSFTPWK